MKIQSKKTTTTTVEVDVILPYYSQRGDLYYYKVISEDDCLEILTEQTLGIRKGYVDFAFYEECVPCTAEEFNAKFNEVLVKLNILNKP